MARTKAQAIAQSTPRPWSTQIIARTVHDHGSAPVKIAWPRNMGDYSPLPPFPFHVYLIQGVNSLIADEDLAYKLLCCLGIQQLSDPCWHLEVFTTVQDNVFACIDHYEREKAFRKLESQAPCLPDKNCFLVVNSDNWELEGLLSVKYSKENTHLPYDVTAERYKSWDHLTSCLRDQWSDQGMTTVEELLAGRNLARGWPIDLSRYPDSGPRQGHLNGMIFAANEHLSQTSDQPPGEALDFEDFSVHINYAYGEQRQDLEGFSYTAIRYDASQAPRFVFCIFILGRDISFEDKLKVFVRLNTGLLGHISWCLHLYSNVTMSSAQSIFALDMHHRNRLDCSTHIPHSYIGPPLQIYRHVYMCLDVSKPQLGGPSFVLSSPDPDHAPPPRLNVDTEDLDHIPSHRDKYAGEPDSLDLFTFNVGSWELAGDMLHTYFTTCSHNEHIFREPSPAIPRMTLRISVNSEISSDAAVPSPVELFITSHASEPITLNFKDTIFDTTHWLSYLRIVDADSSVELPTNVANERPPHMWSLGERLLDYGFTKCVRDSGDERLPHLVTLYPGVPLQLPVQRSLPADLLEELDPDENEDDRRFLENHKAEGEAYFNTANDHPQSLYQRYKGSWKVGSKYTVELCESATIPRWTWGTEEELKGPYGLPALGIEVEEGGNRDFVLID